jgi:hypothetical protein
LSGGDALGVGDVAAVAVEKFPTPQAIFW